MFELYCFDICAISIALTVLFTILLRKMTKSRENRTFILLLVSVFFTGIFDMISTMFNTSPEVENLFTVYFATGMYFFLIELSYCIYCIYVLDITGTRHLLKNSVWRYFFFIPLLVVAVCTLFASKTHIGYYFDETSTYLRTDSIIIFYICGAIYCVYSITVIFRNLEYVGLGKALSLCSCSIFSLMASFIQFKYPFILVNILGLALSLLFTMLFVANPEEKMDLKSLLLNYDSYQRDSKRAVDTRRPITVIMINITNFSNMEKMFSYDNMIELLRRIAGKVEMINETYELSGDLYYINNGQFRIVVDSRTKESITSCVEEVYAVFNSPFLVSGLDISLESNVCVINYPKDFSKYEEFINFGALYFREPKHSEILYASELLEQRKYDIASRLDAIIEKGILNQGFEVYYQPVYCIDEKRFTHAEALVRLRDDQYGLIMPDVFIQGAEANGTITRIGRIVLEEVCKFIASDEYKSLNLKKVCVNVSAIQLMQRDYADEVISTLQRYSIRLDQIILEVRESEAFEDQKTILDNIDMLSRAGIELSIDDYGAGYTNMTMVSKMPTEAIKLDRGFVTSEGNEKYRVVVENSIALMKALGKKVVVEGIETKEFLDKFIELGSDYIQGFYFSKPLPEHEFVDFVKAYRDAV